MKFIPTKIKDCYIIDLEKKEDDRGFLTRVFDKEEFGKLGIVMDIVQGYLSRTKKKGTVRGIHYQIPPLSEYKLTKVVKGAIFEIVIDLRKDSKTYMQMEEFEFKDADYEMLIIPPNCGHAILTLEDNTEFINFSNKPFTPQFESGIRFDDPTFNINWPIAVTTVSDKDRSWESFDSRSG